MKKVFSFKNTIMKFMVSLTILSILSVSLFVLIYMKGYITKSENDRIATLALHISSSMNKQLMQLRIEFEDIQTNAYQTYNSNGNINSYIDYINEINNSTFKTQFFFIPFGKENFDLAFPEEIEYTIKTFDKNYKKLFFSGPYMTSLGMSYFLLEHLYINDDIIGTIGMVFPLDILNEYCNSLNVDKNVSILCLDSNGKFVLSDIKIHYPEYQKLLPDIHNTVELLYNDEISSSELELDNGYMMHISSLSYLHWNIITISNSNNMVSELQPLFFYLIIFIIAFSFITITGIMYQWQHIDNDLNILRQNIKYIRNRNYEKLNNRTRIKEFEPVVNEFNKMASELDASIIEKNKAEKQKQLYEYRALISQINPHFLYNTLNAINALVDLKRYNDIPPLSTALSQLLSSTLNKKGTYIDIKYEIDLIEKYTDMMKIRYPKRFDIDFDIDENIKKYYLLNMLLLPIVENAVFHGFPTKMDKQGIIKITALIDNKDILFYIEDNGVGMTEETQNSLLNEGSNEKHYSYNRIGLINVHKRLQLHYGEKYGLKIYGDLGLGTIVEMRLPIIDNIDKLNVDYFDDII